MGNNNHQLICMKIEDIYGAIHKPSMGYSILVSEGGGMENFADPPHIFSFFYSCTGPPAIFLFFSIPSPLRI